MLRKTWKRSTRHRKLALAARWTQVVSSCLTTILLIIAVRYFYWETNPLYICSGLYTSSTNAVVGSLGLVMLKWPEKIHWHVMAVLDILALAAITGALGSILAAAADDWWGGTWVWGTGIFTSCLALLANLTMIVQTARTHFRITIVSEKRTEDSTSLPPKSLKDNELWPADLRAYDLEEHFVHSPPSLQAPPPEASNASASQDIADMPYSVEPSEHDGQSERQVESDDKNSSPARSLSEICHWSITSGTLTGGGSSVRSAVPSYEK